MKARKARRLGIEKEEKQEIDARQVGKGQKARKQEGWASKKEENKKSMPGRHEPASEIGHGR